LVTLNKALSPSNSFVSVAGTISNSGGSLKLLNFGPNLVVGDKFKIFNQSVIGAGSMTMFHRVSALQQSGCGRVGHGILSRATENGKNHRDDFEREFKPVVAGLFHRPAFAGPDQFAGGRSEH